MEVWENRHILEGDIPDEDVYDHLHTLMICHELNALGELKVFDHVVSTCFNNKLEVKTTELLSPLSHLMARLEFYTEVADEKIIGIYSKDGIWAITSRLVKAINLFNKLCLTSKSRWRGIPFENYVNLYNGRAPTLVKAFSSYMIDNTTPDITWDDQIKFSNIGYKLFSYPIKYIFRLLYGSKLVKQYIKFCVPKEVRLDKLFMLNLPSFYSKNKYKSALYFESNDKFIPRFLAKLEMYSYASKIGEDSPDLYWSDQELLKELYENSNTDGRKHLLRFFNLKY